VAPLLFHPPKEIGIHSRIAGKGYTLFCPTASFSKVTCPQHLRIDLPPCSPPIWYAEFTFFGRVSGNSGSPKPSFFVGNPLIRSIYGIMGMRRLSVVLAFFSLTFYFFLFFPVPRFLESPAAPLSPLMMNTFFFPGFLLFPPFFALKCFDPPSASCFL